MPQLDWGETDFIDCLEVFPTVEEYETMHVYEVSRNGLLLQLTVKQLDGTVRFSLLQPEVNAPLLEFALFVRGGIRHIKDKRGRYLEFQNAVILAPLVPFAYATIRELSDKTKFPHSWTVQLQVKSHIHIRYDVG